MKRGSKWFLLVASVALFCEGCASPINVVKSDGSKANYVKSKKIVNALIEPDAYVGKWIKLYGQIATVEDGKGYMVRYSDDKDRYFFISTENTKYKANDYVKVDAKISGIVNRKNAFGDNLPVAELKNSKIKKSSYDKVEAPAYKTATPSDGKQSQQGVHLEVAKVEYANSETRVYMTVTNKTKYDLYFAPQYTIVQQGDTVISPITSEGIIEREGYPQIDSTISPKKSSSGIVLFGVFSSEQPIQIVTSIYDSLGREYDFTVNVQ